MKKAFILTTLLATAVAPSQQAKAKVPYAPIFAGAALASGAGAIYCHIKENKLRQAMSHGEIGLESSISRYKLLKYLLGGTAIASGGTALYFWLEAVEKQKECDSYDNRIKDEEKKLNGYKVKIDVDYDFFEKTDTNKIPENILD
jgi:hypothetical protein